MDILLRLLAIDELHDMIMFQILHDRDFGFEVLEELGGKFRADD